LISGSSIKLSICFQNKTNRKNNQPVVFLTHFQEDFMVSQTQIGLFSRRTISVALAFVLVALILGVFFLFRPFPAGPSLGVKANVPEAASAIGWSAYANPSTRLQEAASLRSWSAYANAPVAVKKVSVVGWSAYVNAPVAVKEAASVVGWSAYANPSRVVTVVSDETPQSVDSIKSKQHRR
jgi:hypothetical protein